MKKLLLLLVAALCLSGVFAPSAKALRFVVVAEDRPYYIYGPGYWSGGVYWGVGSGTLGRMASWPSGLDPRPHGRR